MKERSTTDVNFLGMSAEFLEPNVNKEASNYMTEHYDSIRAQVRKMGIPLDMVDDLVSDVWLSISEAELRGEGYDVSFSNEGDVITVEEFVFGRIKRYSMNTKYHNNTSERHASKDKSKTIEVYSASCSDASDLDKLDGFQKAYALAASYDEIEDVDAEMSLRSNIEFCLGYNDIIGFNIINFFKNMDMFASMSFNPSIFDKLKDAMNCHTDFRDAFKEVMLVAVNKKPLFESIVSAIA